jgi:hypothetical protein
MKVKKIPSRSTVAGRLNGYAYRAGFTVHPQTDGTIALFDIRAKYYVFRGSRDRTVGFILDELHLQSRLNFESSPPSMGV